MAPLNYDPISTNFQDRLRLGSDNNYYGLDPSTGKWGPLYYSQGDGTPATASPGGDSGVPINGGDQPRQWYLGGDPSMPSYATAYKHEPDSSNWVDKIAQVAVPAMLGVMGGGAFGLFGAGAGAGAGATGAAAAGAGAADPLMTAVNAATAGSAGADVGSVLSAGAGADLTSAFGGTATGGGLLDWLGSLGSGASGGAGGAGGSIGSNLAIGGANLLVNQYNANRARQQAGDLLNRSDSLQQPARFPFQAAANDMVNNPGSYFANNPFATSMANYYKNNVIPANIAKSGNTGFDTDRLGAQFATALGGNYNELLNTLSGYGGFTQGAPSGASAVPLLSQSNNFLSEAARGLGPVAQNVFGTPSQPKTPQANPITGSYQMAPGV